MGRKSPTEEYRGEIPEKEDEEEGPWRVLYEFKSKPNPRFWADIKRLIGLVGEGTLVQHSVFMTKSRRGAMACEKIARAGIVAMFISVLAWKTRN